MSRGRPACRTRKWIGPSNRPFYKCTPPRSLAEIDADLKWAEEEIARLLREVTA